MSDVFKEWTTGVVVNLFDYQCPFCGKRMRRSDAVAVGGWRNVLVHPLCKAMIEDTKNVGALEEMRSRCANSSWEGDDLGGPHCPPETLKVVVRDDYAGGHHDFILFDKFGYVPQRQMDHTGNRFLPFTDHHNPRQYHEKYLEGSSEAEEVRFWNDRADAVNRALESAVLALRFRLGHRDHAIAAL